ncbi:nuclease harbi1 [Plakobranchus ocellatus]|uniref:Nuclease harbi1 n=1 Tax=Plakobranchus ocellatus TaxID=259542 RepID=A0AAV4APL9_9GAST|nr:nuclease harbi1 [Plakobranchus ocellatus]
MAEPNITMWKKSSDEFYSKWNFPNCVGAIDGKHIRLKKPALSGATYWNYKGYCSIILLAVVDANGRFLVIDVGSFGGCSDGGIFRESQFGKLLIEKKLHLTAPIRIPQTEQLIPPVCS